MIYHFLHSVMVLNSIKIREKNSQKFFFIVTIGTNYTKNNFRLLKKVGSCN
jgi:hypothetical protein